MQRINRTVLAATVGLVTLLWVGVVNGGMPGVFGQWPGFEASEKGFPGWSEYDQDKAADLLGVTRAFEQEHGYGSYQGFEGAQEGQYPGGRPNGR
jgi:hypothetical protein